MLLHSLFSWLTQLLICQVALLERTRTKKFTAFLYCKRRKAGQGLGTRLSVGIYLQIKKCVNTSAN